MKILRNNILKVAAAFSLILLIVFLGFLYYGGSKKIRSGVKVEGVSFSGLTKQAAGEKLRQIYFDRLKSSKVVLSYENKIWEIPFEAIHARYDTVSAIDGAFKVGRDGNLLSNFYNTILTSLKGQNIHISVAYDRNELINRIKGLEKEINKPGKDAEVIVDKGSSIRIIPEKPGVQLDVNKSVIMAEQSIMSVSGGVVPLQIRAYSPKYKTEDLKEINTEIALSQTSFNSGQGNRSSNIKNAIKRINGKILMPGEAFSLHNALGPRNEENGYKSAPVILNDELVLGVGGGVCQVATTLYRAILQAGLAITERQHHTFPPAYVPVGQDATIAGNYIDFKFKNSSSYPIFIFSEALNNRITIKIFSKRLSPKRKVRLESQVLEVEDPEPDQVIQDSTLISGTTKRERSSKKGYKVMVYRNIYEGKNLINRELISNDYYKPIRGVIIIGTRTSEPDKGVMMQNNQLNGSMFDGNIEEPDNPPDAGGVENFY